MSYTLSSNLSSQPMSLFSSEGENSLDTNNSPDNSVSTVSPSNFLASQFDDHMDDYDLFSAMDHSDDLLTNELFSTDTSPSYGLMEDMSLNLLFNELEATSFESRRDELRAAERMRKESLSNLSNNVPPQVVQPQFQLVPMNSNRGIDDSSAISITNKENAGQTGSSKVIDTITIDSSDDDEGNQEVERMKMQIEKIKRESKLKKKKPLQGVIKSETDKSIKQKSSGGWQRNRGGLPNPNTDCTVRKKLGWQRNRGGLPKPNTDCTVRKKLGWQRSLSSSMSNSNRERNLKTSVIDTSNNKLPKCGWQRATSYDSAKNLSSKLKSDNVQKLKKSNINKEKSSNVNSSSKSGWQRPLKNSCIYPDHDRISMPVVPIEEPVIANIKNSPIDIKNSPIVFNADCSGMDLSMVKEETVIQDSLIHSSDVGNEVIIDAPFDDIFEPLFEPKTEKIEELPKREESSGNLDLSSCSEKSTNLSTKTNLGNNFSFDFDSISSMRPRSSSTVREIPPVNVGATIMSGLGRHQKKIKGLNDEIREKIATGSNGSFLEDIKGMNDSVLSDLSSSLDLSNKLEEPEEKPDITDSSPANEKVEDFPVNEGCFTDPIAARTRRGISHTSKQPPNGSKPKKSPPTKPKKSPPTKPSESKVETASNRNQSEDTMKTNNAKSGGGKKKKTVKKSRGKCIRTIEENLKRSESPDEMTASSSVKDESEDKVSSINKEDEPIKIEEKIINKEEQLPSKKEEQSSQNSQTTNAVPKDESFSCLEGDNFEDLPDDFLLMGLSDCMNHPSVDSAMKVLINEIEIGAPSLFPDASKSSFMSLMNDPFGGLDPLHDITANLSSLVNDFPDESLLPMVNPSNVLLMTPVETPALVPSDSKVQPTSSNGDVKPTNCTDGKVQPSNSEVQPIINLKKEVDPTESPVDHNYAISPVKSNKPIIGIADIKPNSPAINKLSFEDEPSESKSGIVKSEAIETQGNIINKLPGYLSDSININSCTKKKIDINQYKKRKSLADNTQASSCTSATSVSSVQQNKYSSLDSMLSKKTKNEEDSSNQYKKLKQKSKSKKNGSKKKKASESSKSGKSLDGLTLTSKQAMYDELNRDCDGIKNKDVSNQIKKMILQAKLKDERDEITQKLEMKVKASASRSENGNISNSFGSEIIKNMTRSSVERGTSSRSSSVHPTSRSSSRQYFSNDCERLYSSDEKRTSRKKKSKKKHRKRSRSPHRREKRYYDSDESEYTRSRSKKKRKRRSYSRSISSSSSSSSSSCSSQSSHSTHRRSKKSKRRKSDTSSSSSRPYSRTSSHYQEAPYSPPYSCSCIPDPNAANCRHYCYNYPQYPNYPYCSQYPSDYPPHQPHKRPQRHHLEQDGVDRNVLHIGNITQGTTREYIRERFSKFGRIVEVRMPVFVYDDKNFGFVKFSSYAECLRAIEKGNENEPIQFKLCFGNRREFCKQKYKDLDALPDDQVYVMKPNVTEYYPEPDSYDAMLSEFKMMKNNR